MSGAVLASILVSTPSRIDRTALAVADSPTESGLTPDTRRQFPGLFGCVGLLILYFLLSLLAVLLVRVVAGSHRATAVDLTLASTLTTAATLAIAWRLSGAPVREVFPIRRFDPMALMPLLLLLAGVAVFVLQGIGLLMTVLPTPQGLSERFAAVKTHPLFVAYGLVIAPTLEEMLFRGVVLRGLLSRYPAPLAIAGDAVLFGCVHLNPWQFGPALALGTISAWLFVRSRSLSLCVLAHVIWNGLFIGAGLLGRAASAPVVPPLFFPLSMNLLALVMVIAGGWQLRGILTREYPSP